MAIDTRKGCSLAALKTPLITPRISLALASRKHERLDCYCPVSAQYSADACILLAGQAVRLNSCWRLAAGHDMISC